MGCEFGLATSVSKFTAFRDLLIEKCGGAINSAPALIQTIPDYPSYTIAWAHRLTDADDAKIIGAYKTIDDEFRDPRIFIVEYYSKTYPLLGSSDNTKGFAWQIRDFGSGDTIVKFAQCWSDNPLDILEESFQSWGITAYDIDAGTHSIHLRDLGGEDLLAGSSYGGFMTHPMIKGGHGLTIFSFSNRSPIFTWSSDSQTMTCTIYDESSQTITDCDGTNGNGIKTYVERERLLGSGSTTKGNTGDDSRIYGYEVWCEEPYDKPKRSQATNVVLAPITCPGTASNYAKTAKFLLQSPYSYNPFDGSQFFTVEGGAVYYSDYGACACATGEGVSPSEGMVPKIPIYKPVKVGDNDLEPNTVIPSGYKKYFIEF